MMRFTRYHRLVVCAIGAAALYFTGLGRSALWEPDEGRYGEIAREMIVRGDYVTPHDDWVPYLEKPPLVYWATAAALKTFGRNEFAVRSQAALASVGSVVVTAALGEAMFGAAAGMLAAVALALSPIFFLFARFATPDPALAFFFAGAMASFYAAACSEDFAAGAGRRYMMLAAAMLALGTLVKGPVALVLPGAAGLLWLLVEHRAQAIARIRWLECGAIYVALVIPWFIVVASRNPGFLSFFIVHEHWQRFLTDNEHGWGPWFFVPIVPAGTWPWLYFALLARGGGRLASAADDDAKQRGALRLLMIWVGVVVVFFSIPRAKLGEYILPAIPPIAIMAAVGLMRLQTMAASAAERALRWFALINLLAMVVVASLLMLWRSGLILSHHMPGAGSADFQLEALLRDGFWLALVLGIGSSGVWIGARTRMISWRRAPAAIATLALLIIGILARAREDATPLYSYRELAAAITPSLQNGCSLASYHHFEQTLPFYTGTREALVGYRGELAPFAETPDSAGTFIANDRRMRELWSAPRCMVLIVNQRDLEKIAAQLLPVAAVLGCEGKKVAVINREQANATHCEAAAAHLPGKVPVS